MRLFFIEDSYKEINYHLCDSVQSDDIEPNMHEVKRWFDEGVSTSSDENFKEALKLFISMDTVQNS